MTYMTVVVKENIRNTLKSMCPDKRWVKGGMFWLSTTSHLPELKKLFIFYSTCPANTSRHEISM